jgi:DNA-binding protein
MTIVYLDEIETEDQVLAVITDLENEVIEAVTAERGKRQKISSAQMQVKQLMKKCGVNRWTKGKKKIERMFSALEREAGEYMANMWSM